MDYFKHYYNSLKIIFFSREQPKFVYRPIYHEKFLIKNAKLKPILIDEFGNFDPKKYNNIFNKQNNVDTENCKNKIENYNEELK
jgi:hypothetical protein